MITIILDEQDTDRLLRILYNGIKPARVHTMVCLCGTVGDLRETPKAWNGWQVLPHPKCPKCLETTRARTIHELFPYGARSRFMLLMEELQMGEPL